MFERPESGPGKILIDNASIKILGTLAKLSKRYKQYIYKLDRFRRARYKSWLKRTKDIRYKSSWRYILSHHLMCDAEYEECPACTEALEIDYRLKYWKNCECSALGFPCEMCQKKVVYDGSPTYQDTFVVLGCDISVERFHKWLGYLSATCRSIY